MRAWIEYDEEGDCFALVDDVGFELVPVIAGDDEIVKWAGLVGWSGEGGTVRARGFLGDLALNEVELSIDIEEIGL